MDDRWEQNLFPGQQIGPGIGAGRTAARQLLIDRWTMHGTAADDEQRKPESSLVPRRRPAGGRSFAGRAADRWVEIWGRRQLHPRRRVHTHVAKRQGNLSIYLSRITNSPPARLF